MTAKCAYNKTMEEGKDNRRENYAEIKMTWNIC